MAPWIARPSIDIDVLQPIAERFRETPSEAIAESKSLLSSVMEGVPELAKLAIPLVQQRTQDRFQSEFESLAETFGIDWRDLLIANISYDLTIGALGCSTIALPTPTGPVVARNMDWWPEDQLARASYVMTTRRDDKLVYANAGWPGAVGAVTGLSGNGFAVVLNAVMSPEGARTDGYPVMLYMRKVLEEANHFDAALEMLQHETLAASALITLVGRENHQRVVIERSPSRHALRWGNDDAPLVATNDYRKLYKTQTHESSEIYRTTCIRYDAICKFFSGHRSTTEVPDEKLLYLLTDEQVIQGITAQHIIMRPAEDSLQLFTPRRFFENN